MKKGALTEEQADLDCLGALPQTPRFNAFGGEAVYNDKGGKSRFSPSSGVLRLHQSGFSSRPYIIPQILRKE